MLSQKQKELVKVVDCLFCDERIAGDGKYHDFHYYLNHLERYKETLISAIDNASVEDRRKLRPEWRDGKWFVENKFLPAMKKIEVQEELLR